MQKGQTHYVTPHPETMTHLLRKYHNRDISLQTYWRNMKGLENGGYISRQSRWDTRNILQPRRRPSMIALTIQGAKYLQKIGVAWASQILGAMIKWAKKGDQRFPAPKYFNENDGNNYEVELEEIRGRAIKLGFA